MIRLSNVSVKCIGDAYYEYYNIIKNMEIKTIQELIDIKDMYPEVDWSSFDAELKNILKNVEESNSKGIKPVTYTIKEYKDTTLNYTDTLCSGFELIFGCPVSRVKSYGLDTDSIASILSDLSTTTATGENYLVSSNSSVTTEDVPKIIDAISLYREQLLRQAELTRARDINVFNYLINLRRSVVKEKYDRIINYLIEHDDFIWGSLSSSDKRLLSETKIDEYETKETIRLRNNMIKIVSDYITAEDAEKLITGDYRPLQRFLKK